jgi:ribosome-associated protein
LTQPQDPAEKCHRIALAALDKKAEDVVALDVRGLVSFADGFVIATGNSDRHVRSIVTGIEEALRASGEKPIGIEGQEDGRWVLMDYGDVVVHVFQRDVRAHYDLERLWADAPRSEFAEGDAAARTSAS